MVEVHRHQAATRRRLGRLVAIATIVGLGPFGAALPQDQQITPNFQDTDIRTVTESVMALTGRNVILDPRINARVTLFSNTPVSADGFYELYLATLQVHGYAVSEVGNVVRVVPEATARQLPSDDSDVTDAFVTRTVSVRNVGAAQLVPILRPLINQIAHFAAHPESNMLIVSDRAGNVDRIVDIIRRMDIEGRNEIEFVTLRNASATDVVATLQSLAQTTQAAQGVPGAQFIGDARTNSIMLSGTEAARLRYRAVIVHLDTPITDGAESNVRYLQYADAEELASAITSQFGGTAATEGAPGTPGAEGVTIWSHPGTNALVINAPPRVRQDINRIIDQLDIRPAQVQVEAIIVELSEDVEAALGITWIAEGSGSNTPIGVTNFPPGGIVPLAGAGAAETGSLASAITQGLTVGVGRIADTGTSWAALLQALRGDANTNIVSRPTILARDNVEAEIKVGQQVPFVTGQYTNTGAAQGSVNPFTTVQREDVGTTLRITPQINDGSGMILTIEQETSSLSSQAGAVDLITNERTITTEVYAEDGQIIVLGGLTDDQLLETEQSVPGIGRIPGLGWLFKSRRANRVRQNLFVFIRPTILRDGFDATIYTNSKYNFLRQRQLEEAEEPIQLMRSEQRPILPDVDAVLEAPAEAEDGSQP